VQLKKVSEPEKAERLGKSIFLSEVQRLKSQPLKLCKRGRVNSSRLEAPTKAQGPLNLFTLGKFTFFNFLQPSKVESSISVKTGKFTVSKLELLPKAPKPI
jgi:hypothetical protein